MVESGSVSALLNLAQVQTFVFDLADSLNQAPVLEGMSCHLSDRQTLEVAVARGTSLNAVFSQLQALGVSVLSMRNKQNRLEEWFLQRVTNRGVGHA